MWRYLQVVLGVLVALLSRPAYANCEDGATSVGYEQCQKFPACKCESETKGCSNGGWYTQYTVVLPCPGYTPPGAGSGSGSGTKPKSECDRMRDWLKERYGYRDTYKDQDLVDVGNLLGWSPRQYHLWVWRLNNPQTVPRDLRTEANMVTDWRTCKILDWAAGCNKLGRRGLPPAACQIATAHELEHINQCKKPGNDPTSLANASKNDVDAYNREISEIEKWLRENCP